MTESIPELIARRMGELHITSLLALHRRLEGPDSITYETVRNLANGKQRSTRDERVIRDLAIMLQVDEDTVRKAVGADPTYGPWGLPARAQGLDPHEREVVISVVDALLRAKRTGDSDGRQLEAQKSRGEAVTPNIDQGDVTPAARHARSRGKQLRTEIDAAGEESQEHQDGES